MDAALEAALHQASQQDALDAETCADTFTALRRACAHAAPAQLAAWEKKADVLNFLASFYEQKRLYHRQVMSLLEILLQQPDWAVAAEPLRPNWPEEMAKAAAAMAEAVQGAAESGAAEEPNTAQAAATQGGYQASEVPVAPQRSMADTLAMLDDALKKLADAKYSFSVLTGTGLEEDDLVKAFELFRRAVCRVTQDVRIETTILEEISPKESILQFLLEVMEQKPRQQKRIESLMLVLMKLDRWRRVAEEEPLRGATARFREPEKDEKQEEEESQLHEDSEGPNPEELLADAQRRGAFGVLLVRVLAAHNLINADWWSLSDPYTKVTVDGDTRVTAVVDDCLDPRWDEELWSFDVAAESSLVRLEVWDKDAMQDDPLGHVAIPVAMAPGEELKRLRFALDRVAHGELEVEMRFLRVETDDSADSLLQSGGASRKLPSPKAAKGA
ncbi:unnamed protein product [Durusdinium trenchii]|uniref:C2 domain-containing protein n=2 Tax=Durusdinium trenchii TaxID=1381693 RepID=A0ABP0SK00_9DINO